MNTNTALLFNKIRHIQFQTTRLANDVLAGAYRSAFKGKGMEFDSVREYQSGDEIRSIDWNVTARMNHPYVKTFKEERELTVTLVVDISASTRFGSGGQSKSELIAEIGALIAFSAIKNHDKVSLVLFSDRIEKYYPPGKTTKHVLKIIRELLSYTPTGKGTDISVALSFLGKVQKHSSVCFLISDFIAPEYAHEAAIISKGHDLISIMISDFFETQFPNMNLVVFNDLETGLQMTADTSDPILRRQLSDSFNTKIEKQKKLMDKLGAGFIKIETKKPYLTALRNFFLHRQRII